MRAFISLDVKEILSTLINGVNSAGEREFCEEVFEFLDENGDQIKGLREEIKDEMERADAAESKVADLEEKILALEEKICVLEGDDAP